MDTPRFNDAVLNHILGTLNGHIGGILQEQQTQMQNMHAEFNQWASQQQEQEQQLRSLLAKEEERANELQRWADFVTRSMHDVAFIPDAFVKNPALWIEQLKKEFKHEEQRKQDDITAAIALQPQPEAVPEAVPVQADPVVEEKPHPDRRRARR